MVTSNKTAIPDCRTSELKIIPHYRIQWATVSLATSAIIRGSKRKSTLLLKGKGTKINRNKSRYGATVTDHANEQS
jgi:hypothetical protein